MFGSKGVSFTGVREKYKEPQHFLMEKDATLPPNQMLEIAANQLQNAKDGELMKGVRVRFLEEGADRTIDHYTKYPKTSTIEGVSAQETILQLRQKIARQERVPLEDINLCSVASDIQDHILVGECYVDWMGFGLEDWPPRFISKPALRGWEIYVDFAASRDSSVWDNGRMTGYMDRKLVFDVNNAMKVSDLKELIRQKMNIPVDRQTLTAHVRDTLMNNGEYIPLENDKTLGDYDLEKRCVSVMFQKSMFDENGDFVFDDAYWDVEGYHAQPSNTWIPADSLCDRARPDANPVDPTQPLSIVSDRRQKEVADKDKADGK